MKIGLSLSGGGFRATVFHLGVLARLAQEGHLEDVAELSTVSGGSLCAGLVYACNDLRWPSSAELLEKVLPRARELLTTQDLQFALIGGVVRLPLRLFHTRADDLSRLLQKRWGVTARLSDLPAHPRWLINATCYETGRNWRFERSRMGDSAFGYCSDTDLPLSDALAASAAYPGLIGPLVLDTGSRSWSHDGAAQMDEPAYSSVHLWDGGVYDNLGVEGLHSFLQGWEGGVDLLIVSDACPGVAPEPYHSWNAANRLICGIMMDQIRSLRFRALLERFLNHGDAACYLQIGISCAEVLRALGHDDQLDRLGAGRLPQEDAQRVARMGTDIRRLSPADFTRLFRHGFEVADYSLTAFQPADFACLGYESLQWVKTQPVCSRVPQSLRHARHIPLHA
jgi:NTE family protein